MKKIKLEAVIINNISDRSASYIFDERFEYQLQEVDRSSRDQFFKKNSRNRYHHDDEFNQESPFSLFDPFDDEFYDQFFDDELNSSRSSKNNRNGKIRKAKRQLHTMTPLAEFLEDHLVSKLDPHVSELLGNLIYFHFSNDKTFNLQEIVTAQYEQYLPSSLNFEKIITLPTQKSDFEKAQNFIQNFELNHIVRKSEIQLIEPFIFMVINLIEALAQTQKEDSFLLRLCLDYQFYYSQLKVLNLSQIHFLSEDSVRFNVRPHQFQNQLYEDGKIEVYLNLNHPTEAKNKIPCFNLSYYDDQNQQLTLRKFDKKIIQQVENINYFHGVLSKDFINLKFVSTCNEQLSTYLKLKNIDILNGKSLIQVPQEKTQLILNLKQNSELYSISTECIFNHGENSFCIYNFRRIFNYLCLGFKDGLSAYLEQDKLSFVTHRRGEVRDNELKLLRHKGAYSYIVLELVLFLMKENSTDGNLISDKKQLSKQIERGLAKILSDSKSDTPAEFNISKRVKDFISEISAVFEDLMIKEDCHFLSSYGPFEIKAFQAQIMQFLKSIIESYFLLDQGRSIYKIAAKDIGFFADSIFEKTNFGQILIELKNLKSLENDADFKETIQEYNLTKRHFEMFLTQLPYLIKNKWRVTLNGEDICQLENSQISAELVETSASQKVDWFELHPQIFFNGVKIELDLLNFESEQGLIFYGGRYYIIDPQSLPKLNSLKKFWDRFSKDKKLNAKESEKKFLRLPRAQILELLSLHRKGIKVDTTDPRWLSCLEYFEKLGSQKAKALISENLQNTMKPHQIEGLGWIIDLYKINLGGILADDMGLGKTIQVLGFLEHLQNQNMKQGQQAKINSLGVDFKKLKNLIVVPTSLVFNWLSEVQKFTPELEMIHFASSTKDLVLDQLQSLEKPSTSVIVSYGLLSENIEYFEQIEWDVAIFDEAQFVKNISSHRTTAARKVKAQFKLALTGTPLENHFLEFYSLIDLVLPGALGSYEFFNEFFGVQKKIKSEDIVELKQKIKPIVLRRTKDQIQLNLPQKSESVNLFDFEKKQLEIYKKIAITHNEQVNQILQSEGEGKTHLAMLTALLRLRQACSDPSCLPNITYKGTTPKIEHTLSSVQEMVEAGKSILIFTQFVNTLEKLKQELTHRKVKNLAIYGAIPQGKRKQVLEEFENSSEPCVLILTLKTGGVGLNLTKASVVFHVEPWWNPSVENQATDRAYRLGQKNQVEVFRLIMKNSVEEKIEVLKAKKKSYFDALFSEAELESDVSAPEINRTASLSKSDFDYLIS